MRNTNAHPVTIEGSDAFYWGGPFSNFTFVEGGLSYTDKLLGPVNVPTVEHAYQGAKTIEADYRARIHAVDLPIEALRLGRAVDLRFDWDGMKVPVMLWLCRRRLELEPWLADLLVGYHDDGLTVRERHPHWGSRTGYIWTTLANELRS